MCLFICTALKGFILRYPFPLHSCSSLVFAGNCCNRLQTSRTFSFSKSNSSKGRSRKEKERSASVSLRAATQKRSAFSMHYSNQQKSIYFQSCYRGLGSCSPHAVPPLHLFFFFFPLNSVQNQNQERLIPTKKLSVTNLLLAGKLL